MPMDRSTAALSLAIALLAVPLTGCIAGGPSFDSYEEAKEAEGTVLAPPDKPSLDNDPDHPFRLKTLVPADPQHDVPEGENDLYFLLFDSSTDEPVTNARIDMTVNKSHKNLLSSHAVTPKHVGNGVYQGLATFDEPEGWVVDLTITLSDGTTFEYPLHYHAGETDHGHDSYFHTKEHQHGDDHGHDH